MALSPQLPNARVLITVKTYPLPSSKYEELVCTAGFLETGQWIRIYPIPFRSLPFADQFKKYQWLTLDLQRSKKDFRPESYSPLHGHETFVVGESISTKDSWAERKKFVLSEVFTSMNDVIRLAKEGEYKSLVTLKPREILDFVIKEDERQWKPRWVKQLNQCSLWDRLPHEDGKARQIVRKLPYKYFYRFRTDGDQNAREISIEDWELGALYWRYIDKGASEQEANRKVREKFLDDLAYTKDLYFFLGTTLQYHLKALNPFLIIGTFYPPKSKTTLPELSFSPSETPIQQSLFDI